MNNYSIQKFHLLLTVLFFVAFFVPACVLSQPDKGADALWADLTAQIPTVPECVPKGDTYDTTEFWMIIGTLMPEEYTDEVPIPEHSEMENFLYRTIYSYKSGDEYVDDDLSVEVLGAHSGLIPKPESGYFPLPSKQYKKSHFVSTDLRSGYRSESIVTDEGYWVRQGEDSVWMAFEGFPGENLSNMAEVLSPSPYGIAMLVAGLGSVANYGTPVMSQTETLHGEEVLHRCWIPPRNDSMIDSVLMHGPDLYTFLGDTEVHLWTTEDDTSLVRLAMTGTHSEERLFEDFVEHETPREFLLWMDVIQVDTPLDIKIKPPPDTEISFTLQGDDLHISESP
jgi:hypothetical protein